MTLRDWVDETRTRFREEGVAAASRESAYELYLGGFRRLSPFYPGGENVFDREWDVLLVLDACRVDLLRQVAALGGYPFLDRPGELVSVGSSSIEWLSRTFDEDHREAARETAYVTGNPFSQRVLSEADLHVLDEVWRYGWDDERGTIPARALTDRAVATHREFGPDRMIVHYMQPHFPSVPDPLTGGMNAETLGEGKGWEDPWEKLRRGELSFERVWRSYARNLEYVLDDVALLLRSLDADRVVITADHGNAAGEWGVYGHPKVPIPVLRNVPWYETSARDDGEYEPELERPERGGTEEGVEDKLSALGYL
ncbi:hypothetical protein ACFO0N_00050 [Halobium salinum]|uniref:Sulfatase n=1 Tax=Halobium salinum TaxID=1364940 RepID=A0ABD5P6N0_9EURY|nr:hypothetical protein [Halobium salinum]